MTADGVTGDLTQAGQCRDWLRKAFRLKEKGVLTVAELFEAQGSNGLSVKEMGRLAFVFGDELDKEGHDDQLKITGTDDHLERYARAVRLLRSAGCCLLRRADLCRSRPPDWRGAGGPLDRHVCRNHNLLGIGLPYESAAVVGKIARWTARRSRAMKPAAS